MLYKRDAINIPLLLLIGGGVFLLFLGNGSIPLLDPDEPVYAETAKEMIRYHSYLSPMIYHHYWYDKPIFFYWVVLMGFKLFGVSGWSARFGSACFGILTIMFTYLLALRLTERKKVALLGIAILSTSLEFFMLGKASVTDMTLLFFLTASLYFFVVGRMNLFYIFMGLAVLTKGPVGIVIAGGTAFFYLYFKHGWRDAFGKMDIARGVLWLLAVAVPWYVYMTLVHGDAFIDTFLGYHNVTRFLKPEHQEGAHYYYYLPVIVLGFFPWTGFIFPIFRYVKRVWNNDKFLVIWSLWVFVFFTLSQTRLPSYILPMFPPLAILMAKYFYVSVKDDRFPKWCAFVPLVIALIMSFVFYKANRAEGLNYQTTIAFFAATVAILSSVHILFIFKKMFSASVYVLYSLAVFFLVFSAVVIFPLVGQYNSTRVFASDLKRLVKPETVFIIQELHVPSVIFYTDLVGKKIENFGALLNNIRVCKKRGERVVILMRKPDYYKLKKLFGDSVRAVRFSGRKALVVVE